MKISLRQPTFDAQGICGFIESYNWEVSCLQLGARVLRQCRACRGSIMDNKGTLHSCAACNAYLSNGTEFLRTFLLHMQHFTLFLRRSDHRCHRIRASSSGIATPSQCGITRAV